MLFLGAAWTGHTIARADNALAHGKATVMKIPLHSGDCDILFRTVWAEARGEGAFGMHAVCWVILNRVARPKRFGATVREVCLRPYQFSCWRTSDPQYARLLTVDESVPSFVAAMKASLDVLTGTIADPTQRADHYYAVTIPPPKWSQAMTFTVQIGRHRFFRE